MKKWFVQHAHDIAVWAVIGFSVAVILSTTGCVTLTHRTQCTSGVTVSCESSVSLE